VCEVTMGETRVLAVVSAKLEPPSGARSNEGTVTINVEFSPMASPNFEPGRPGEEASELAVVLERAIRETGAVDVESLCVLAGRRVWHVRCDVHVLDACGGAPVQVQST
jgi:exosome complex component RRP45